MYEKRAHCDKKQRKKKREFDKQIAQGWSFLKYSKKFHNWKEIFWSVNNFCSTKNEILRIRLSEVTTIVGL